MVGKTGASRRGNTSATSGDRVYLALSVRSWFSKSFVKLLGSTQQRAGETAGLGTGRSQRYAEGSGKML